MGRRLGVLAAVVVVAAILVGLRTAAPLGQDVRAALLALPLTPALGGEGTRPVASDKAFSLPMANLPKAKLRPFFFGNRLFNTNWTQAPGSVDAFDGLGPIFNRVSCSGCHVRDGRGRPPEAFGEPMLSMLVRISVPGTDEHGGPKPHPVYGDQISDRAIPGVPVEGRATIRYEEISGAFADGATFTLLRPTTEIVDLAFGPLPSGVMLSPRVAPQVIGLGLLEAVPEATIVALADPDDADGDGISGRPNMVWDQLAQKDRLGRFGWKANKPSLHLQNAGAAQGDIGLTNPVNAKENCGAGQDACRAAHSGGEPELSAEFLAKLSLYTRSLAVPAQRDAEDPAVVAGAAAFRDLGCAACHMPTLKTGEHVETELAHQTIHPFTDLLLHDMGNDLADGRPDYRATGTEWRTPPLWGLGLIATVNGHTRLLHDGRARDAEEAILWHGGEALPAREAYRAAPEMTRAALLAFLSSL
jgi:CxxC motif-containing protein (DUF1111 family)